MRASSAALVSGFLLIASCESESLDPSDAGSTSELTCTPGETRSCYEGPEQTKDVGSCEAGVQACLPHGRGFGPCVGQVLPEQERCDEDGDENCDGLTSCGQTIWAKRLGGERDEIAIRVAADETGSIYIGGVYRSPVDLGGGELPTVDNSIDAFAAKYDSDGNHVFSLGAYGAGVVQMQDIAVSPSGDAVVFVAHVTGEVLVAGESLAPRGEEDVLVVKLDGSGQLAWARRLGDADEQFATAVALDAEGNVLLTGYFAGELHFERAHPLVSAGFGYDAFVAKLDETGATLWSRAYNAPLDQLPRDIACDGDGRVLVTGRMSGRVDFGGGELEATGETADIFLLALDDGGEHLYSRVWGGEGHDEAWAVAADSAGNAVITGRFEREVRFGAALFEAVGAGAVFVTAVDIAGNDGWATRIGGASEQAGYDIAVDARDRLIVSGYYEGDVTFGDAKLPPSGLREPNIFIAKLEPNGAPVWARGIAVDGEQDVAAVLRGWRSVALLPGDFIALGGFVQRSIDLGDGPLPAFGGADLLFAKLAP